MGAIKQRVFRGAFLRSEPDLLLVEQATLARDCVLDTGKLRPMPDVLDIGVAVAAGTKSIYNYDWAGTDNWLSWANRIRATLGPIAEDAYYRLYYTGDGLPKVKYVFGGVEQTAKDLGVPAGTNTPSVALQDKVATSWERRWGWWYEDSTGQRSDVNRASLRWTTGQWSVVAGAEYKFYQVPARKPTAVYENNVEMAEGTIGSLAASEWGWNSATNEIYVRTASDTDPDTEAEDYIVGEWDYMPEGTTDTYLKLKTDVVAERYSITAPLMARRVTAGPNANLVLWFEAINGQTGTVMGRTYSNNSSWKAQSTLRINGAKVEINIDDNTTLFHLVGVYNIDIDYDLSDASDYQSDVRYFYTLVNILGEEGPPCALSDEIGVKPNEDVVVANLPTTQPAGDYIDIEYKRLYRLVLSDVGTAYQQVVNLWDPADPTASPAPITDGNIPLNEDSVLDASDVTELGDVCPTGDPLTSGSYWNPPPTDLKGLTACAGGFMAGFSGKTLWFCEINYPYAWPARYAVNMPEEIVDIGENANTVSVLCKGFPQLVTAPAPGTVMRATIPSAQVMQNEQSLSDGGGVYFASQDGICVIAGMVVTVLTEPFMEKADWEAKGPSSALLAHYDRWLMCFCSGGSFMLRIGDAVTGIVDLSDEPTAVWHDQKNDSLYLVIGTAIVKWQGAPTYRSYTWTSKEWFTQRPLDWRGAKVVAESYPVVLTLVGDGVTQATVTFTDIAARLIPKVRRSKKWQYTLSGAGPVDEFVLTQSLGDI